MTEIRMVLPLGWFPPVNGCPSASNAERASGMIEQIDKKLNGVLQFFPGCKFNDVLTFNFNNFTGLRVSAFTGLAVNLFESAEAHEGNFAVTFFQCFGNVGRE